MEAEKIIAIEDDDMDIPEIIDFSKAIRNPYINHVKKEVTMKIPASTLNYFRDQAEESGISCETLLAFCLTDCANKKRKITFTTEPE